MMKDFKHSLVQKNFLRCFFCLLLFVMGFLLACDTNEKEEDNDGGPGIIVPGKSIEGIKLGDIRDTVLAKLGNPDGGMYVDGRFRCWKGYVYSNYSLSGLYICFVDYPTEYNPDLVDVIWADKEYKGKTRDGIGIGDTLPNVLSILGEPNKILPLQSNPKHFHAIYCFGKHFLNVIYDDNKVYGFYFGYYFPMPEDTIYSCK